MSDINAQKTIARAYETIEKQMDERDYPGVFKIAKELVIVDEESWKAWYYLAIGAGFGHVDLKTAITAIKNSFDRHPNKEKNIKLYQNYIINMFYSWIRIEGERYLNGDWNKISNGAFVTPAIFCCKYLENSELLPFNFPHELVYKLQNSYISYLYKCILANSEKNDKWLGRGEDNRVPGRVEIWRESRSFFMSALRMVIESGFTPSNELDYYLNVYLKLSREYIRMKAYKGNSVYTLNDTIAVVYEKNCKELTFKRDSLFAAAVNREIALNKAMDEEYTTYLDNHPEEKEMLIERQKALEDEKKALENKKERSIKTNHVLRICSLIGMIIFTILSLIFVILGIKNEMDESTLSSLFFPISLVVSLFFVFLFVAGFATTLVMKDSIKRSFEKRYKSLKLERGSVIKDYKIPSFDNFGNINFGTVQTKSSSILMKKHVEHHDAIDDEDDASDEYSDSKEETEIKHKLTREEALNEGWDETEMDLEEFEDLFL